MAENDENEQIREWVLDKVMPPAIYDEVPMKNLPHHLNKDIGIKASSMTILNIVIQEDKKRRLAEKEDLTQK